MTTDFDSSRAVRRCSAAQLSQIMALNTPGAEAWTEQDLPALLRHQFDALLEIDLARMEGPVPDEPNRTSLLAEASAAQIKSFADLLFHPQPPLELLRLSKNFFKGQTRVGKRSSPAWKTAYLFYLLSILAARSNARKLSTLSTAELLKGISWTLQQDWVDDRTKTHILLIRKLLST